MPHGKFVISLDFELMWGVRDVQTAEQYGRNIEGVQSVIPRLLEAFGHHKVKATFSAVGMLFFSHKDELMKSLPDLQPGYEEKSLSPYYDYLQSLIEDEASKRHHFAAHLIDMIRKYPEHEIGTHTFSHFYCLEKGQTEKDFKADLKAAIDVASQKGLTLTSLVFPRNQINPAYLQTCADLGIICYRGNERSWLYAAHTGPSAPSYRRAFKLLDAFANISGHHTYSDEYLRRHSPIDIPASRFLRPHSGSMRMLDTLKLRRITTAMSYAAKNNQTYHLWWHPHNFGIHQEENFAFLEKVLSHYDKLNREYNFTSYTMSGLASSLLNKQKHG